MEPVRPPIEPMLAKLASDLPPEGDVLYEPKWDGFRALVARTAGRYLCRVEIATARSVLSGSA